MPILKNEQFMVLGVPVLKHIQAIRLSNKCGGDWMMRWCWVNFQCRGVLLIWLIVGQGPTALAVGAGGGVWTFFSLVYHFSFLSPSLWEAARYRLKYYLKGPLSLKQPTNQLVRNYFILSKVCTDKGGNI